MHDVINLKTKKGGEKRKMFKYNRCEHKFNFLPSRITLILHTSNHIHRKCL